MACVSDSEIQKGALYCMFCKYEVHTVCLSILEIDHLFSLMDLYNSKGNT